MVLEVAVRSDDLFLYGQIISQWADIQWVEGCIVANKMLSVQELSPITLLGKEHKKPTTTNSTRTLEWTVLQKLQREKPTKGRKYHLEWSQKQDR